MTSLPPGGLIRRDLAARLDAEVELAPAAARSKASRGRQRPEAEDAFRTVYQVDRDRVLHTKAFRRLKHKTQVFLPGSEAGGDDHVVTRMTHTLQVTQVARALAGGLGLNEPLAEAVALGHDVGHAPFGHTGEEALDAVVPGGWHHAAQSVRILDVLEDRNLTAEVIDGIRAHSWKITPPPFTQEALCVRLADRIAYFTHDALDAVRAGVLRDDDFPSAVRAVLGPPGGAWIGWLVEQALEASVAAGAVTWGPQAGEVADELRAFLFQRVYHSDRAAKERALAVRVVRDLVAAQLNAPIPLPASYRDTNADILTQVVDYVAGMTDRYAIAVHRRLFGPEPTRRLVAAQ